MPWLTLTMKWLIVEYHSASAKPILFVLTWLTTCFFGTVTHLGFKSGTDYWQPSGALMTHTDLMINAAIRRPQPQRQPVKISHMLNNCPSLLISKQNYFLTLSIMIRDGPIIEIITHIHHFDYIWHFLQRECWWALNKKEQKFKNMSS